MMTSNPFINHVDSKILQGTYVELWPVTFYSLKSTVMLYCTSTVFQGDDSFYGVN